MKKLSLAVISALFCTLILSTLSLAHGGIEHVWER